MTRVAAAVAVPMRPRRPAVTLLAAPDARTGAAAPAAAPPLTVTPARAGAWRVLMIRGPIDRAGAAALGATFAGPVADHREPLALDLRDAGPVDAEGVTLLVNDVRRLHRRRPDAVVLCGPGPIRTALERAGVARLVALLADPAELHGLTPEPPAARRPTSAGTARHEQRPTTGARRDALLAEATLVIEARHADPALTVGDVARDIATSARQLQRVFAERAGGTFRDEVIAVRIQHAAVLLQTTDLPVAEVGRRVGYAQASHFAKAFRRHHGIAPAAFRDAPAATAAPGDRPRD